MSATVLRTDALAIPLRDESVDLIVTSPPYFALRSYSDGGEHYDGQIGSEATPRDFLRALWAVTAECWRVLKPTGSLFLNLGDKYAGSGGHNNSNLPGNTSRASATPTAGATRRQAPDRYNQASDGIRAKSLMGLPWRYAIGCIDGEADPDGIGWVLRSELIWSKPNGMPESVQDRVRRSHEQWFHLTKQGTYYADLDAIRQPHAAGTTDRYAAGYGDRSTYNNERNSGVDLGGVWTGNPLGTVPASVWSITTEPLIVPESLGVDHFAAFPTEWPRRLILGWCPPDGVVLDIFGGTGTTAMVARALGRYGVSCDLSADYCRLAKWRIFDSNGASKVRTRTNAAAQADLFGADPEVLASLTQSAAGVGRRIMDAAAPSSGPQGGETT